MRPFNRLYAIDLNEEKLQRALCFIVPLLCGLLSLWKGQDACVDLLNYHRYNPFAVLNNRVGVNLIPAGMQSYFTPTLDIPYYLMTRYWPASWVGFVMGVVHGLTFPLLLGIARHTCRELSEQDRNRIPLLLALAGLITPNFLSELGISMGDSTSSLPILLGVYLIVRNWGCWQNCSARALGLMMLAGLLVGLSSGLKLTNASYAISMCAALVLLPTTLWNRFRFMAVFGVAILIGLVIAAGYWFWQMWTVFGNPLFPQFGSLFPTALAPGGMVSDTRWLPQGVWQTLLWPMIIALNPRHVGELPQYQIAWPLIYVLFVVLGAYKLIQKLIGRAVPKKSPRSSGDYLLANLAIGFIVWMKLFSIYRYIEVIEVMTPLAIWLLFSRLLPYARARVATLVSLLVAIVVVLHGGVADWNHAEWQEKAFNVAIPPLKDPAHTTVLLSTPDEPLAWMIPDFPASMAFAHVDPLGVTPAVYYAKVHALIMQRQGPLYVMVRAKGRPSTYKVQADNRLLSRLGLLQSQTLCSLAMRHLRHFKVQRIDNAPDGRLCELQLKDDGGDLAAVNMENLDVTAIALRNHALQLDRSSCQIYPAFVGDQAHPYQWCRVTPLVAHSEGNRPSIGAKKS